MIRQKTQNYAQRAFDHKENTTHFYAVWVNGKFGYGYIFTIVLYLGVYYMNQANINRITMIGRSRKPEDIIVRLETLYLHSCLRDRRSMVSRIKYFQVQKFVVIYGSTKMKDIGFKQVI